MGIARLRALTQTFHFVSNLILKVEMSIARLRALTYNAVQKQSVLLAG